MNNENISLDFMTIEDLEKIKDILISDFDNFWNYEILKKELLNINSKYIIAKSDNEIVGFGGIWKAVDDIHITNIVTKKNKRRLGIASQILDKLIEISKKFNLSSITLEVNENNIPAINLYEKYGFKKLGIRKKYYNNKDNAVVMTLFF